MKILSVKRAIACVAVTAFAVGLFGCASKEVDYSVEGGSLAEGALADRLSVPESCDETFDVGNSGLSAISCTADEIDMSNADGVKKVYFEKVSFDSDTVQKIVEGGLDKDKGIYVRESGVNTKSELLEMIESAENEQEQAASDGDDEYLQELSEQIEEYEQELTSAPDSLPAVTEYDVESKYYGEKDGRNFQVMFRSTEAATTLVYRESDAEDSDAETLAAAPGSTGSYTTTDEELLEDFGEDVESEIVKTEDEAYADAVNVLEDMGVTGLTSDAAKPLYRIWTDDDGETVLAKQVGYAFTFVRRIDGVDVADRMIGYADNLASLEEGYVGTATDSLVVNVSDEGVLSVAGTLYADASSVTDGEETDALSWDELLAAANTSLAEYYEKYPTGYDSVEFNHLSLVYLPYADDDGSTCFIPAWEFLQSDGDGSNSTDVVQIAYIDAVSGNYIDVVENAKKLGIFEADTGE